jgi:hypothetical protein
MNKKVLSFSKFNEQENILAGSTGAPTPDPASDTPGTQRPETEREAKSRIATSIVKSLFGDMQGLTGGVDSEIEMTKEVKESLPYKGCGASEPYQLEKTPISVATFKILLNYLQEKKAGDYTRSINELNEKRAVIIGIRNKLNIKKEASNQDRFCDALYFIPGNAKDGSTGAIGATGATGAKESLDWNSIIEHRELSDNSRVLSFENFYSLNEEESSIDKMKKFVKGVKSTPKSATGPAPATGSATGPVPPANLGDTFVPYQITTVPSLAYYGKKPMNPKGAGIKLPGDTLYILQESTLGHGKYKMMVEGEKIKVGRYPIGVTKYETYKPAEVYTENCGMQIHRSSTKGEGICVGPWSAGCQVFSDYDEFKDFISKAEKEGMNASKFIYALIQLDDIPEEVMKSAMLGTVYSPEQIATVTPEPVGAKGATGAKVSQQQVKAGGLKKLGRIT